MADVKNETQTEVDHENTDSSEADKKLANMVNSAVTSQLKRHLSKFESSLLELKESFGQARDAAPKHSDATREDKKTDDNSQAMREIERLKTELNAEKARVREEKAYTALRTYLSDKVIPERVDVALKLFKADQKVQFKRDPSPQC